MPIPKEISFYCQEASGNVVGDVETLTPPKTILTRYLDGDYVNIPLAQLAIRSTATAINIYQEEMTFISARCREANGGCVHHRKCSGKVIVFKSVYDHVALAGAYSREHYPRIYSL